MFIEVHCQNYNEKANVDFLILNERHKIKKELCKSMISICNCRNTKTESEKKI